MGVEEHRTVAVKTNDYTAALRTGNGRALAGNGWMGKQTHERGEGGRDYGRERSRGDEYGFGK